MTTTTVPSGFDAMGRPIPTARLSAGLAAVRDMWPDIPTVDATALVGAVADRLERDEPYDAMGIARNVGLDVTGTYRLIAVLLAAPTEER